MTNNEVDRMVKNRKNILTRAENLSPLSKEFTAIKASVEGDFKGYTKNLTKQINLNQDVAQSVTKKYAEIYDSF